MKYFVVFLAAYIVSGSFLNVRAQTSNPEPDSTAAAEPIDLGTFLEGLIKNIISLINNFLSGILVKLVPKDTVVVISDITSELGDLRDNSLGNFVNAIFSPYGINLTDFLNLLPSEITNAPISVDEFENEFAGCDTYSVDDFKEIFVPFETEQLTEQLTNLLNALAAL